MATWPSGTKASTTNLDAGTDSPASARADIKQNTDNVNSIIDMFNIATPSNNQILKYNTTNTRFELASDVDTGITDVVQDTTPQLGGNLDVNGNSIVSASNANIEIAPDGTGDVYLTTDLVRVGDSNANATITTNGTGDLILSTNSGSNSGVITIQDGANNDIVIEPNGTGNVNIAADTVRIGDHNSAVNLTTYGTSTLTIDTHAGTNSGSIVINHGNNGNISITPDGTGNLVLDGLNWPQADGTADYVLKTNGSGQLSWVAQTTAFNPATPGAIGGTTASAGTFTTLTVNAANDLRLADTDSSHYVGFKAPATVTTNKIWTLPSADGTNGQVLSTNGSATLSWATAGGGGASIAVITQDAIKGTLISGSTYRQTISEYADPSSIITVTSNQFTVSAGTYIIEFVGVNKCTTVGAIFQHQLYNVTGSTAIDNFSGGLISDGTNATRFVFQWSYVVTPSSSNTYEIRTLLDATSNGVQLVGDSARFRITKLA